jgi:ribosomal-protein-alanine N-acetyltransferase
VQGQGFGIEQDSKSDLIREFDNPTNLIILIKRKIFIIRKKDGTRMGIIRHLLNLPYRVMEVAFALVPSERGKGYGTEAIQLMVDYLFLSYNIFRIQTLTDVEHRAAQKVLKKLGFKTEGAIRKLGFERQKQRDCYLHSILREEWKETKTLTRTEEK